jgi:hypothetical protein
VLLTTIVIDPNGCIYPIAFAVCEVECTNAWEWFLTTLKDDLKITNTSPWTIMSDRHKDLINAVEKVFPDSEHRFCVGHLIHNFQRARHKGETLKNDIWAISRSTCIPKWQRSMDKLKSNSQLVPNTWIKVFFNDFPKCDMILNNLRGVQQYQQEVDGKRGRQLKPTLKLQQSLQVLRKGQYQI